VLASSSQSAQSSESGNEPYQPLIGFRVLAFLIPLFNQFERRSFKDFLLANVLYGGWIIQLGMLQHFYDAGCEYVFLNLRVLIKLDVSVCDH